MFVCFVWFFVCLLIVAAGFRKFFSLDGLPGGLGERCLSLFWSALVKFARHTKRREPRTRTTKNTFAPPACGRCWAPPGSRRPSCGCLCPPTPGCCCRWRARPRPGGRRSGSTCRRATGGARSCVVLRLVILFGFGPRFDVLICLQVGLRSSLSIQRGREGVSVVRATENEHKLKAAATGTRERRFGYFRERNADRKKKKNAADGDAPPSPAKTKQNPKPRTQRLTGG